MKLSNDTKYKDKHLVSEVIKGILLKHDAKRWTTVG